MIARGLDAPRLVKQRAAAFHHLIGADHQRAGVARTDAERFRGREQQSQLAGIDLAIRGGLGLQRPLVDLGRLLPERQTRAAQNRRPPGARRGQDQSAPLRRKVSPHPCGPRTA